jgi:hypothetical protein
VDADFAAHRRAALILAAVGMAFVGAPVLALAGLDHAMTADWIDRFGGGVLIGATTLFFIAADVGPRLAHLTAGRGLRVCASSAALALSAVLISTALGGAGGLLFQDHPFVLGAGRAVTDQVVKPLAWALLLGGAPALALGACHPALQRRIRRRLTGITPSPSPASLARPPD